MSKEESVNVEVSDLRPMLQKFSNLLSQYINEEQRWRLGKVLTVIDASIADQEQRKAIKDIIQGFWWNNNHDGTPDSLEMNSPNLDLTAICEALGFDLHPSEATTGFAQPMGYQDRVDFRAKSYKKAVNDK